jgi:hypothetical protein
MLIVGIAPFWSFETRAQTKPNLAILPFFVARIENPARGAVKCPICKSLYQFGDVVPGSQNTLTRLFYGKIEALGKFRIFALERVEELLTPSARKEFEEKPIPTAIQIGRELNADFILVGYLFRFEERIGSSIGVEKPASVAFDVHLFRVKDGMEVWKGVFDETQRPLSENLLKIGSFLRRGASWLTADELASDGMDEMLNRFPGPEELGKKS